MKAFIRWVWVLCLFPPRVFGQAKLPITTSDHFVVEAPAVVQPGGETVDFIVGVEGFPFLHGLQYGNRFARGFGFRSQRPREIVP